MKTLEIRKLLEKYYNGETSIEEELQLKQFFENESVPVEYSSEKAMFRFYNDESLVPEPSSDFERRIISTIDDLSEGRVKRFFRSRLMIYSGIAASFLILFGSIYFFSRSSEPGDTFTNPEIAYNEAVKILFDVSSKLNYGTRQLETVNKIENFTSGTFTALNRSTRILENNLKNLDYFQQAVEIVSSPIDKVINK